MAYQIVAVNDSSPGACSDVGMVWDGTTTLTLTGDLVASGGFSGGASCDITINTDQFTVDATNGNTLVAGTFEATGAQTLTGATSCASTLDVAGVASFADAVGLGADSNAATNGAVTVPVDTLYDGYTTNNTAAIAATLADGEAGQIKVIKLEEKDTNDMVLTPANFADGTDLTFDATGEIAVLVFDGTNWQIVYSTAGLDA